MKCLQSELARHTSGGSAVVDVLVIGAGPAGSVLGYHLARRGVRVLIIDRERFPRDKVCGGGISQKTLGELDVDPGPVIHTWIHGALLTYGNQHTVEKKLTVGRAALVTRSEFDDFLLRRAIEAGASVLAPCSFSGLRQAGDVLEVATSRGLIRARHLAGADGVFSRVRRTVFGQDLVEYVPSVEALIPVGPDVLEALGGRVVFDFGGMPRGYGWIFPKRDHVNIGVFSLYRHGDLRGRLLEFRDRYDILRQAPRAMSVGHAVPVGNRSRRFRKGNVWLVGDAAGLAEAFFGEGIYYAVRSARLAAEDMVLSFEHPPSDGDEDTYGEALRRDMLQDLEWSARLARVFFAAQRFGYRTLVRKERLNNLFAGLITGELGHREVAIRVLAAAPSWFSSRRFLPAAARL
jgi:geranylgeranyl reductase family protein